VRTRGIFAETTRPQTFDVTYRDDVAVDATTFDKRDLRVTGPGGFVAYAKFERILATMNDGGMVTARYKLAAPGGTWDAADNGEYTVRLRDAQVGDTDGHFTAARTLVRFVVRVGHATGARVQALAPGFSNEPIPASRTTDLIDALPELR
jgi:hypothetical protein